MKRCPACEKVYAHGGDFCAVDGSVLVDHGPRTRGAGGPPTDDVTTMDVASEVPDDSRPTVFVSDEDVAADEASQSPAAADTEYLNRTLLGTVISDRYRIEKLIGRGGMGAVFQARHLLLDKMVAVKLLLAHRLHDEKSAQRFFREAQAMAKVEHPNAVAVYDFGMLADGAAFIVMEFIEGETLRSVLNRVGLLDPDAAVAIAAQICGAVEAAHRQGVVHRDLKPENIMFKNGDDGAVVKVVDFGLAKVGEGASVGTGGQVLTSAGELFGTPAYMAPEYYEAGTIGPAADVYSIGVMVYEMLSGRPPFQGTIKVVMSGHLFKEPPPLDDDGIEIGDDLKAVVARSLKKDPRLRYASASELAEELVAATGRTPASVPAVSVQLDSLRMRHVSLGPDDAAADPLVTHDGSLRKEPPQTESVSGSAIAAAARPARSGAWMAVVAIAGVVVLGSTVIVGTLYAARSGAPADAQPVVESAAPAMEPAPSTDEPNGPEISGREEPSAQPQPAGSTARSATAGRDRNRMAESEPEADSAAPVAEAKPLPAPPAAAAPAAPATADQKKPADQNANKNAAQAKDAKKKKKWWNPKSWF